MDRLASRTITTGLDRNRTGKRVPLPVDRRGEPPDQRGGVGLAPSYPQELERHAVLDDGTHVRVRPVRADDEARLENLYSRLSEHSAYQRFFAYRQRLPAEWYHYFANVDYRRRLALVAERGMPNGPELIGVGRYEPTDEEGVAEVAFVVQDGWQGRGLGEALLSDVLAAAESRGIRRFRAFVLADNHAMLQLLTSRTDVRERKLDSGVVELSFTRAGGGSR